ncbi:MAG TPA: DUF3014 domain-containing protein [Myxococcales bacterium]|nr:DUF3014 domain-containing protein [Myxococcales bacterium]
MASSRLPMFGAAGIAFVGVLAAVRILDQSLTRASSEAVRVVHPMPPRTSLAPLPPVSESDARIRELLRPVAGRGQSWLRHTDLLTRIVLAVANIADDACPRDPLEFAQPARSFASATAGTSTMGPRSYSRFDRFATMIASIDAAPVAEKVRTLLPWLDAAWEQVGYREKSFRELLVAALQRIQRAPLVEGSVPLRKRGAVYHFVDAKLEALGPIEKHLLRMGPRNTRLLQEKAHELEVALAFPVAAAP